MKIGQTGMLISIDGSEGVVRMDEGNHLVIMDLKYLASIPAE